MRNFKLRWRSIAQAILVSAAVLSWCGTALAQTTPVNGFIIINPISVVCSGSGCLTPYATYGVSCTPSSTATTQPTCTKSPAPASATPTTPIGFVDASTNLNLTRVFWAQAGIDVVFFPIQSYNSPTTSNKDPWPSFNDASTGAPFTYSTTSYQTLHLVNVLCADGYIALTSPDFQALTQHPICTEHGGLPSGSKLANPPAAPSTLPPLAKNGCSTALPCDPASNAIDVFFVYNYMGTGVSNPQYGFSWINGNGVSVGSGPFSLTAPRYDTFAHEIGHALALTHQNYGANNDPDSSGNLKRNMMLLGSDTVGPPRATSKNPGCQSEPTYAGFTTVAPAGPVYNAGVLYDLGFTTTGFDPCGGQYASLVSGVYASAPTMVVDHLVPQPPGAPSACPSPLDPTTCSTQQGAAALSPFINKSATNQAGGGTCAPFCPPASATISTSATTAVTTSSTGTALILTIQATGDQNDPTVPELVENIIALPASGPLSFNGNSPITQVGGSNCAQDVNHNVIFPLTGCDVFLTGVTKLSNQQVTGNPGCDSGSGQPPSAQCARSTFSPGFRNTPTKPNVNIVLAVSFNKDQNTIITQGLLAGAQYTSVDGTFDAKGNPVLGFATTSLFEPFGVPPNATGIVVNSANPDLETANVLLNESKFQNATAVKLVNTYGQDRGLKLANCTQPWITVKIKGQLLPACPDGNLPEGGE